MLKEILELRHEQAQLLGYADWPEYDAEVKMIGSGAKIIEFIDRITAVRRERRAARSTRCCSSVRGRTIPDRALARLVRPALSRDADQARELRRRRAAGAAVLRLPGGPRRAARRHRHGCSASSTGPPTSRSGTRTSWRSTCTATATAVGRIYLDLHPREGKFKHAAQFDLRAGVAGRQLPEGVLVCNFPRGLMEHDDVVTLFHEFGHLVHHVLAGHQRWMHVSGIATEWDFVEAPSQMLEEWAWDADVLQTFARDEDGEPIPADLVAAMRAANEFGKGYFMRTQMFYAAISYLLHRDRPDDLSATVQELQQRYDLFDHIPDTHFHASFGHLTGYSSGVLHLPLEPGDREGPVLGLRPGRPVRGRGRAPLPRPRARARRQQGRRRPGRGLPRPALLLRRVHRLAGHRADAGGVSRRATRRREPRVRS